MENIYKPLLPFNIFQMLKKKAHNAFFKVSVSDNWSEKCACITTYLFQQVPGFNSKVRITCIQQNVSSKHLTKDLKQVYREKI